MEIIGYITLSLMGLAVVSALCYCAIRECEIAKIKAKHTHYTVVVKGDKTWKP